MGFFSKIGDSLGSLSLSNQLVAGLTGKKPKGSASQTLLFGKKNTPPKPEPFNPQNRIGATINGQTGPQDLPALKLGWTNGGYTYNNSPFNQPKPAAPMSFGGGAAPPAAPSPAPMGVAPPTKLPMPMQANPMAQSGPKMDPRQALLIESLRQQPRRVM